MVESKNPVSMVHSVIAFANSARLFPGALEGRLADNPELHLPRLSKIFDALATLCISQPKGEVIALTLQTLPSGVVMVVAGNSDIPEATRLYLYELWDVLQQLSRDYAKIHGELNLTHSRNRPNFIA